MVKKRDEREHAVCNLRCNRCNRNGGREQTKDKAAAAGGGARVSCFPAWPPFVCSPFFFLYTFFYIEGWLSVVFVVASVVASVGRFVTLAMLCLEGQRFTQFEIHSYSVYIIYSGILSYQ